MSKTEEKPVMPVQRKVTPWSPETRRSIIIGLVVLFLLALYWIRETLIVLVLALLMAYLLNPLVGMLMERWNMRRILATALVYLVMVGLLIWTIIVATPLLFRQVTTLAGDVDEIVLRANELLKQLPLMDALGFPTSADQLSNEFREQARSLAANAPRVFVGLASGLFEFVLILVLSFYLLKDADMISTNIDRAIPEEYYPEAERIKAELVNIWSSFLRGQIILALIIGTVTSIVLLILGVRNWLLLGILAGILEVVPTIGPIIAMIPSVVIALLQGSANWQIDNVTFAIIVLIAYLIIQQLENHLIVPNLIGSSVNLPPVVILFGALAGASLAGILGVFLAAPVLATARELLRFVLSKLFEPIPAGG